MSPAVPPGMPIISTPPILVQPESLPQAAAQWAALLPPYAPILAEQLGVLGIGNDSYDLAGQAVVSATNDWPNIYNARFNQRQTKAEDFVTACDGTSSTFVSTDQDGADDISSATGPTLV
jgi:hypothetical protein